VRKGGGKKKKKEDVTALIGNIRGCAIFSLTLTHGLFTFLARRKREKRKESRER